MSLYFLQKNKILKKIFVAVYVIFWVFAVIYSWMYWGEMSFWVKALLICLEIFLMPDIQLVKDTFRKVD